MILAAALLLSLKYEVNIWVSKDVAPSDKIRLNINTRNSPNVHIDAFPVNGESWLKTLGNEKRPRPNAIGRPAKKWDISVAAKGQRPNPNQADTFYSRQINLPPMRPGVYLLDVKSQGAEAWAVVNVTNLAVVVKRSPRHALVWVTDFKTGHVVPDAEVTFFDRKGSPITRSETKHDGATRVDLRPGEETVVIRRGSDMAGVPTGAENPDGQLRAHFQTDRPIYRPGQTIQFKATLRHTLGQGYSVVGSQPCTIQIRDPKDNPFDEIKLTSSPMGTVAGQFELPQEGMTGAYSLVLTQGKQSAYQTVTVAEYRKPEFKVEVNPGQPRYLAGEDLTFEIDSQYYFGAPVPQAEVKYTVRRDPMPFEAPDDDDRWFYSGDGNLYPRDTYHANPFVAEDTVYTDDQGKAIVHVKAGSGYGDNLYRISCTVTDGSRRQVEGSGSAPVYGAAVRLGLSTKLVYASLGSVAPIDVRLIDLDGKPVSGEVDIEAHRQVYDEKTDKWADVTDLTTSVNVPALGKTVFQLPARHEGQMRIEAFTKDAGGRTANAELFVDISGNFEKPAKEKEEPKVQVVLDRHVYDGVATANALVTTNNPGHPILLTLEGGDVWDYHVIPVARRSQTWPIPITTRYSPNAFVGAVQWASRQVVASNVILPVPDRSKILNVSATPDRAQYHPGDRATYTIQTHDGKGKPVPAEVVLAVVDEAIYALSGDNTPDLFQMYWGQRANLVTMHQSAPEELSGGAYQRSDAIAPLRQRFEDTAYWNPLVDTDASGTATVSFEMPGNLTTWRATARGVTADTAVGSGTSKVLANRPVMLRLATPRLLVQGDRLTMIGTIDNRSDSAHDFEVDLNTEGVNLEGETTKRIRVEAKTQAKVQWMLRADDMPATGNAVLTARIAATDDRNPDYGDALRVSVPVVPNGLPETQILGGPIAKETTFSLDIPSDHIEPASVVTLVVRAGLKPALLGAADEVLRNPRYGSDGAANQLRTAAATGLKNDAKQVKESLALLSKNSTAQGWSWWEHGQVDPIITANVVAALGEAKRAGIKIFDTLILEVRAAAVYRFNQTNLWEHRALLAAAAVEAGEPKGRAEVEEVLKSGKSMSPYARLRIVGAMIELDEVKEAKMQLPDILALASVGPVKTYFPSGDGIGWAGSDIETTAEALVVLAKLNTEPETQRMLAAWLTDPEQDWMSLNEDAAVARALAVYLNNHPEPAELGEVHITAEGTPVEVKPSKFEQAVTASIPRSLLKAGANSIQITRSGPGEATYILNARVYRPANGESTDGVRVLRRFEVKNAGGTWVELNRDVKPGEPVRCTMVAWGDDIRDSVKITEPIPAGFEYIEGESNDWGYQEVRDGAVIHYLTNTGSPQTYRYYIRAEVEGNLAALPSTAEYLRRPAMRGRTNPFRIKVVDSKSP